MKRKRIEPPQRAKLIAAAKKARRNAYCPFTHYAVGAAVLGESGKVYGGCNIESPTAIGHSCAERVAIFNAVSNGERRIEAVCTVSNFSEPCGYCRQMISEFSVGDTPILSIHTAGGKDRFVETTISRLLPHAHTKKMLEEAS